MGSVSVDVKCACNTSAGCESVSELKTHEL